MSLEAFVERVVDAVNDAERRPLAHPSCSVAYGSAGIAWGLHTLGEITSDDGLEAASRRWLDRTRNESARPGAFESLDRRIPRAPSVFFGDLGAEVVDTLLTKRELRVPPPSPDADLALGPAGLLAWVPKTLAATENGRAFGDAIASRATVAGSGLLHGRHGLAFAAIRWWRERGRSVPPQVLDWAVAPIGGARICDGSPGRVLSAIEAFRATNDERFLDAAIESARATIEHERDAKIASLCCGFAGRAYAVLQLCEVAPADWLRDGIEGLIALAVATTDFAELGLFKGALGPAILVAQIMNDAPPVMPILGAVSAP